jgi:predicted CXXCH cytochrome family protein
LSFIVRQISRTADGREIIRPRRFDQPEISVGRGTDSDIHLPDLAVTLHHAAIRQVSPGKIEIVATAGLPFDVDGRSVQRADVEVARGANVRLGSHVLGISRGDGESAGAVVISVERVGAVSDASEAKDEAHIFSLAGALPGKRASAWALVGLVLAMFLAWPIFSYMSASSTAEAQGTAARPISFHADETWSTGKLSQVHASLENNCQACHQQPFVSVRDDACAACHTTVHDHADPRRLAAAKAAPDLSGRAQIAVAGTFNVPQGSCVQCHTEHEGATAMPVTQQRFCSDCHNGLDTRLTDTKILNATDFGTDHPQFRPAVMTNPEGPRAIVQRVSLDARPLEDNGLKFPHDLHLSRTNGVAQMARTMRAEQGFGDALACANCHTPDDSGARFKPVDMEKDCAMCHSLAFDRIGGTVRTLRHDDPKQVIADLRAYYRATGPVRPTNLEGMSRRRPGDFAADRTAVNFSWAAAARGGQAEAAIRSIFSKGGACFDCHRVTQPGTNGSVSYGIVPARQPDRYFRKGWFDHASHETETCQSCHAAETSSSASDVLLPKIADCRECHGGEAAKKAVPSSCAMCHDYHMSTGTPLMVRKDRARGKRFERIKAASEGGSESGA